MTSDKKHKILHLSEDIIRDILKKKDDALIVMMREYHSAANGIIKDQSTKYHINFTEEEKNEMIQNMWVQIVVDRLEQFDRID